MVGHRFYNYYDRKFGVVTMIDTDGWFDFEQDDNTVAYLNGERICTVGFATAKGWK